MAHVPAKIEKKYVPTATAAVLNLYVHILEDVTIKAGQVLRLSSLGQEAIEIMDIPSAPHWATA